MENTLKEYREQGIHFCYQGIKEHFPLMLYHTKYEFIRKANRSAMNNVLKRLNDSYQNYFKNKVGFPCFKTKKDSKQSFTVNMKNKYIKDNIVEINRIGNLRFIKHRDFPPGCFINNATIVRRQSGRYYIVFEVVYENQINYIKDSNNIIGLDFSLKNFYIDSNGNSPKYSNIYNKFKKQKEKEIKKLNRMQLNSKNYNKQAKKVSKVIEKIINSRRNFLHNVANELIKQYDYICVEDLDMKDIVKDTRFSFKAKDISWGTFVYYLTQKAFKEKKLIIKIDRFFPSSQICSSCGYVNKETKNLNIREWTCPECNAKHDRDINAAKNILKEGKNFIRTV